MKYKYNIKQIIRKNKNSKNVKITLKNAIKTLKIHYTSAKITKISKKVIKLLTKEPRLYPEYMFFEQKDNKIELLNNLSQKLNSQICKFRSVKRVIFVDYVAKFCADSAVSLKTFDLVSFVQKEFGVQNLYKKETYILPYLVMWQLFTKIIDCYHQMKIIEKQIFDGAKEYSSKNIEKFSDAKIYGIVKYNKNLLIFSNILDLKFQKCVFNLITKLNKIQIVISRCLMHIDTINKNFCKIFVRQ